MTDRFTRPTFETYDSRTAAFIAEGGSMLAGLPEYLGFRHVDVGPGTMTVAMDVRPDLMNPFGAAHGGVVSALVDHVLGAVLYPLIPRRAWAATTEFKLNFLAPAREGLLQATAEVISLTRRSAVVRIDVSSEDRLVAIAQGTVTIQPPRDEPASG